MQAYNHFRTLESIQKLTLNSNKKWTIGEHIVERKVKTYLLIK